jgi:heat shock protein HslJ
MRTHRLVPLLLVAVAAAGCTSADRGAPAVSAAADAPAQAAAAQAAAAAPATASLTNTEWQLAEFPRAGKQVRATVDSVLRFGEGHYSTNVCNQVEGAVAVTVNTMRFSSGISTGMMCHGEPADVEKAFHAVTRGAGVTWEIKGSRLWLRSARAGTLVYDVRDSIYPARNVHALVAGERNGWQYRLAAGTREGGGALVFEARPGPGHRWGVHATGAPSPGEKALWSLAGGGVGAEYLMAGFAPLDTTRVTHRVTRDAPEVELAIHRVEGSRWAYFGGFVAAHSVASTVTIYGAGGRVIETWEK